MATTFEIPSIPTDRLILRAFSAADFDAWSTMEAKPEVRRYRGNNPRSRQESWSAMETMLGQWAMRGYGTFAVERRSDGAFIGFSGILHPAEWPEPELAYSLDTPFWGQGYASEAARAARDWAFSSQHFRRLASFILPENAASIQVAKRLGATQDGTTELRGIPVQWWVHWPTGHGPIA